MIGGFVAIRFVFELFTPCCFVVNLCIPLCFLACIAWFVVGLVRCCDLRLRVGFDLGFCCICY